MPTRTIQPPWSLDPRTLPARAVVALMLVGAAFLFSQLTGDIVNAYNDVLVYLVGMVLGALLLGRWPARLALVVSLAILSLEKVHPAFQVSAKNPQWLLSFALFGFVGEAVATLSTRVHQEVWKARALGEFAHECSQAVSTEGLQELVQRQGMVHFGQPLELHLGEPVEGQTRVLQTSRGRYGWLGPAPRTADPALLEDIMFEAASTLERLHHQAEAARAETEKARNLLIHSLSHDLQTPVATIVGVVQALADSESGLDEPARQAMLALAGEQSQRLQRMVKNILSSTRLEGGAVGVTESRFPVRELIDQVTRGYAPGAQARVQVEVAPPTFEVDADYSLLSQMLANLLDNAFKYSAGEDPVEVLAQQTEEGWSLMVDDRGPGVEPDEAELIFQRFYRAKSHRRLPGSGLGLSIVAGLANLHGGQVTWAPRQGGGSRFALHFPAS